MAFSQRERVVAGVWVPKVFVYASRHGKRSALGSVLLAYGTGRHRLRQGLVGAGGLGLCVAVTALTPRLRFADIAGEPEKELLHYEEDSAGIVQVATDIYERKLLSINGCSVAGTGTPDGRCCNGGRPLTLLHARGLCGTVHTIDRPSLRGRKDHGLQTKVPGSRQHLCAQCRTVSHVV